MNSAKRKDTLLLHCRKTHEGLAYECEKCEYKSKCNGILQNHIQSVHDGITYTCEQCDF